MKNNNQNMFQQKLNRTGGVMDIQLYHDESFLERVIIFQRYHGKNKLYLMR
jgi:hypothetical protein